MWDVCLVSNIYLLPESILLIKWNVNTAVYLLHKGVPVPWSTV